MEVLVFLIFLFLFAIFVFGVFSVSEGRRGSASRTPAQRSRPARSSAAHRRRATSSLTAREAMQRAGYTAGSDFVQIADIGLLAYRQTDQPRLVRQGDVTADSDYLRPFAELWVPFKSRGPVRFELVDGGGRVRYADEERYDLEQGSNTLVPGTWLPLRGKSVEPDEEWRMRIRVGQTLLAVHTFGWQAVGGGVIRQYIESDGEISPELRRAIQASAPEGLSLAELLGEQADEHAHLG